MRMPIAPPGIALEQAGEPEQPQQERAVDRVPAHGVAQLVADDEAQLVVVEVVHHAPTTP